MSATRLSEQEALKNLT